MFVLKAGDKFYTGRAGDGWVGSPDEAFGYANRSAAEYKAGLFNKFSSVHGLTFKVVRQ